MGLRLFTLTALLLCASASGSGEVEAWLKKVKGKTLTERVESAGLAFYGAPYIDAPLGEGPTGKYDRGDLYRFDAFDCTTYVETVLALAQSKKAAEFERNLARIRYQGDKPDFTTRNHFPCVDWIPHNMRTGLLKDVTEEVGARWGVHYANATVDKKSWFAKLPETVIRVPGITDAKRAALLAELHSEGKRFAIQNPSVAYIALDTILKRTELAEEEKTLRESEEKELARSTREDFTRRPQAEDDDVEKVVHDALVDLRLRHLIKDVQVDAEFLKAIPSGAILNVVRPGWQIPGTKMNISHQGFVIQKKEGTYFRHVSRTSGRVKDVPLANYLRLCLLLPSVKGVNILALK